MSHAQELPAAPSAVTALSGAEASGAASHSSEGNGIHSFGGQVSPRAARSQISTAVSFEGARAAGSAALPSRSLEEESALSAAEGDVECSHSAEPNQAAPGSMRPRGGRLPRPSNSLISTAVQPASPHGHLQQPVSPKLNRANSVVSHTAPRGGRPQGGRAGTPASVYGQGQGFLLPSRAWQQAPAQQLAAEQDLQAPATAGIGLQHPGLLQPPQAWQQMPPAFPGLQPLGGLAPAQQQGIQQSLQPHQHSDIVHNLEHRDSFDGHHRSSDNGGGCPTGHLVYRALDQAAEQQARDAVAGDDPAAAAAGPSRAAAGPATAAGTTGRQQQNMPQQQAAAGMQQPSMQLFHNALAGLPAAVAGGLLQGVLGQNSMGIGSASAAAAGYGLAAAVSGAPAAVTAGALHGGQAATGAAQDSVAANGQQSTFEAGSGAAAVPIDLLQQLGVQIPPAMLAVLQGQAGGGSHADATRIPRLPYTHQQLQQGLSFLLAGLASQAEQYGLVFPGIANGTAMAQQQLPGQVATTGMRPPPVPAAQAKSCDSSIQGAPATNQGGSAFAANAAVATLMVPPLSQAHAVSPMAAAAAVGQSGGYSRSAQQLGLQQIFDNAFELQQHETAPSWPQQQRAPICPSRQPCSVQPVHWRSPSPSPAPVAHAAARTSAAGEGHCSLNRGGPGAAYLQSQHLGDAAAAAISSAGGGASRAGGGLTSEEGEAEAPEAHALVPDAAVAPDDAGQQASIGDAAQGGVEWQEDPEGAVMQQAATSPKSKHQRYAPRQPAAAVGYAAQQHNVGKQQEHYHQQQHLQQQPQSQQFIPNQGDPGHAAASVHATMVSEDNASGSGSDADSEQSSTQSGGSNSNRGGAGVGQQGGADVEIVSQLCGASHSASPPPSASRPAAATATCPVSGHTVEGSGVMAGSGSAGNAAAVGGLMDAVEQAAVPARLAGGTGGRNETHHSSQQHQQQLRSSAHAHRSNQHLGDAEQRGDQQHGQRHKHRDSSLAMATAGPTGARSTTTGTHSGTVDMSIHNDSQHSGAGSQGDAPEDGGWAAEDVDDVQGATNSRDGEARGEPPGTFETAESGRAAEDLYQPQLQHLQQQHQQHQHIHAASPMPGYSAAGPGLAAAFSPMALMSGAGGGGMFNHAAAGAAGLNIATAALPVEQHQQPVGFATASTPADANIGSPSLQGGYSSSNVGIPGVSAAGAEAGMMPGRESSAAGGAPGNHVVSAGDEVDAVSALMLGATAAAQEVLGDNQQYAATSAAQGEPAPGVDQQPQPAAAQHIEQAPLCAAFSVTSQLQPTAEQHAAAAAATGAVAQHHAQQSSRRHPQQQVRRQRHQHHQQGGRGGGSCVGTNLDAAPPGSVMTTSSQAHAGEYGHAVPAADAVPQVTEIHGHFAGHSLPATAAAAQMAAAAAAAAAGQHAHAHSDVHPQVTELHGMLGASAGTAAEAQLAAAAAVAAGHDHTSAAAAGAAAAAFTGGGITGSTVGDGRLPPLPHAHSGRAYTSHQHRPPLAAAGSSRIGQGTAAVNVKGHGLGLNMGSPPPNAAYHSRAHYSPPAVNFDPHVQPTPVAAAGQGSPPGTGSATAPTEPIEGTGDIMPAIDAEMLGAQLQGEGSFSPVLPSGAAAATEAPSAAVEEAASPVSGVAGAAASNPRHSEQQQCPGSPSHGQVQGNSQLGQQDGSRGSPPVGMGRVGSVPPQDVGGAAGGGEVGVVEQQPPRSRRTASEDEGSRQLAAVPNIQQQQQSQQQQLEQEADGPSHTAHGATRHQQCRAESKSGATSPAQRHKRTSSHAAAVAAAAVAGQSHHDRQQLQQHWQQLQGHFHEGAGQVGGRTASLRFSCGQAEGSVAPGISSKVYGSFSAGFASGSKAEGSPSYGAGLDGCSCGNGMASGANGYHPAHAQQNGHEQHDPNDQQQAQSNSTRGRGRPRESPAAATAAAALQEGEGSHGSQNQEARSCKRQRTSCEAVSVHQQQQQHMTSSMQTTEA